MAGAGAKKFPAFSKLSSDDVNNYLADQVIMRFATTTARDAAFGGVGEPTLAEGMTAYIDADNSIYTYDGSNWVKVASTAVPAGNNPVGLERVTACTVTSVGGTPATASNGVITIGTNNSSITVNNAFSSDYLNYRIIITNDSSNGGASHLITLNNSSTLYYVSGHFFSWGGGGATAYSPTAQPNFIASANNSASNPCEFVIDLLNPFATLRTTGSIMSTSANGSCIFQILNTTVISHTAFTLSKAGDLMTGGNIRVYGYRN